jgi:HlyD family secretion protein
LTTRTTAPLAIALLLAACERPAETQVYRTGEVLRKDIVVTVEAAGVIEPFLTVEVKSKASGEILAITGETGDFVEEDTLLVQIDKRVPRNQLAQAEARLEAARARRSIADAQSKRAKTLFASRTINEVDYEQTVLELANAKAEVVGAQVEVENARIALDDTDVRAPISGTIIEKLVEKGQVISSPTMDVGGGTLLLKMADLSRVQVKTLVDETDIGKIGPGLPVTVTVTSYPNQPFSGEVLKVEPQAMAEQTVTTFSVLMTLDNESGLLRPGMNADVEIRIAARDNVVAVPTAALRTLRDIPVASQLVGLTPDEVRAQLGAQSGPAGRPGGAGGPPAGGPPRQAADADRYRFANRYWVFVKDGDTLTARNVETGLTDLDYSEVTEGLAGGESVVLLPSSGLVQSQQRLQQRMRQFTSLPGMSRQQERGEGR